MRTVVTVLGVIAAVALPLSVVACASEDRSAGPATIEEAYRSAHPTGNLPTTLTTVAADVDRIAREVGSDLPADVPVVLPRRLPVGYGLAAPYVAVGSGAALPNPEVWPGGYRTSFTDGRSLVVVAINLADPPSVDASRPTSVLVGGRRLYEGVDGQALVLGTEPSDGWQLTVTGLGLARKSLERFAAELRVVD